MTIDKPSVERVVRLIYKLDHTNLGHDDYWAITHLAQAAGMDESTIEHFANLAIESGNDNTYDSFGVNTRNSFNTP